MSRRALAVVVAFFAIGLAARVAPLMDETRLLRQFPTEDAYLMLTVSRNLAQGYGWSVSEGTVPTNGTQPLATLLWAAVFWAVDGDRRGPVAAILWIEVGISTATALLLVLLGRRVLACGSASAWPWLLAGGWYASSTTMSHSMNGLETGLYALVVLVVMLTATAERSSWIWVRLGALLGIAFLVRNDAVFLGLAIAVALMSGALPAGGPSRRHRAGELGVAGAAATLIALPWIVQNFVSFGSIVPVSGRAQLASTLGQNAAWLPPALFEYLFVLLPVPSWAETHVLVGAACSLAVLGVLMVPGSRVRTWAPQERAFFTIAGVFGLGLCGFYGIVFGAPYFLSRYLFPLSAPLAITFASALWTGRAVVGAVPPFALGAAGAIALALAASADLRLYLNGTDHPHFQCVEWVARHVPEDAWVGAIQSGTVGFFHDRTINLDGKVDPAALAARFEGRIPLYVEESAIEYLVDWEGITTWLELEEIARSFDLVVHDAEANLGVLRRRTRPHED